jgi:hypothetical protein
LTRGARTVTFEVETGGLIMTDEPTATVTPAPTPTQPIPTQTINIQTPAAPPSNGLAVASMVLGIVSLFLFWIPFLGWVPVLTGLILGIVALQKTYGRGFAIAGVVCAGLALAIKVWFWLVLIGIMGAAATTSAVHGG